MTNEMKIELFEALENVDKLASYNLEKADEQQAKANNTDRIAMKQFHEKKVKAYTRDYEAYANESNGIWTAIKILGLAEEFDNWYANK